MIVIYNQKNEDGLRYRSWERVLTQRGKEVVLDCLEAGLEAYEEDAEEDDNACDILNDLISLFKEVEDETN